MEKKIDLSIITVGMNHLSLLKEFLRSLYVDCKPKCSFELIYVDNCSNDGTIEFIKTNYNTVKIVSNTEVQGFAFNNNLGFRNSSGSYVAIINPDVILLPDSIDSLYTHLKLHPEIGILVPKLLNSDLTVQFSVRKFISLKILFFRALHRGNDQTKSKVVKKYLLTDFDTSKIQYVDWAIGAAMLFHRDWFEFLNGFDEDYFLYLEDEDICLRSWKYGRSVLYFPESVMIHAHQRSSNQTLFNKKKFLHIQSMFTFFKKHNIIFRSYNFTDALKA